MKTDFANVIDSFLNHTILIIGDVMVDSYLWGKVERISPEAPVPVVTGTKEENRMGGAANVALNIQSLGATPILCSVIGNDDRSKTFFGLLKELGITHKGILQDDERITTVKTRVISQHQHLLRIDQEIDAPLSASMEEKFVAHIRSILATDHISAIIFQDYDKGSITPNVIREIVDEANKRNIPTLVDPKKRNFGAYRNVTLFKPNFKELVEGLKVEASKTSPKSLNEAAKILHKDKNIKLVMITLSEAGVYMSNDKEYRVIPAHVRDIADVSGAGDTVISVVSLCLASGLDPFITAAIANMAGGLVCEKVGAVPIEKELLKQEVTTLKIS